jgi:hypothetical protein
MRLTHSDLRNQRRWLDDDGLIDWLSTARLNLLAELLPPLSDKPRVRERVVSMFQAKLDTAMEQLEKLLSEHNLEITDEASACPTPSR